MSEWWLFRNTRIENINEQSKKGVVRDTGKTIPHLFWSENIRGGVQHQSSGIPLKKD